MITRESIQCAYSFFHQKERIYRYSTMPWQRDDIEYAIDYYSHQMSPDLYELISGGRTDFLRSHTRFHEDILSAMEQMERML